MKVHEMPSVPLADPMLNSSVSERFDFNPFDHPIVLAIPRRLTPTSAWHEHIPFAMYLISRLKPATIVELGTHTGDSYCAFCQAVQELNLDTRCYAVDTWQGDAQSGFYGPEVLQELRAFHDPLYGGFSQLIQSTFSAALENFADGSIDLLHLDGYHTYEAARTDLLPWLNKLSPRGVILLHDVNVHERDFGIWRLWEELQPQYPHFEFYHGHGLGVLAVGALAEQMLDDLFSASRQEAQLIRTCFFRLGQGLESLNGKQDDMTAQLASNQAQIQQLTHELAEQNHSAAQLHADKTELQQHIQTLTAELNELKPRAASERLEYESRITALQQTLAEQSQHLDALTTRIERMATRETELRTLFLESQAELMERDQELDQMTSAASPFSQQHAQLEFLNAEISNYKQIIASRDEGIEWLRAELDAARSEIRTLRSSRVWRLRDYYSRVRTRIFGKR